MATLSDWNVKFLRQSTRNLNQVLNSALIHSLFKEIL